jgi:hypothetical protein
MSACRFPFPQVHKCPTKLSHSRTGIIGHTGGPYVLPGEDKLIGRKITIVTDHKSLEFFKTQGQLSRRQSRWWEYLSQFNYKIRYIKGKLNVIADIFSRFYHNRDTEPVSPFEYVSADRRLDPEGEDLPVARYLEVCEFNTEIVPQPEECDFFARSIRSNQPIDGDDCDPDTMAGSHSLGRNLATIVESSVDVKEICICNYPTDSILRHIIDSPDRRDHFHVRETHPEKEPIRQLGHLYSQ